MLKDILRKLGWDRMENSTDIRFQFQKDAVYKVVDDLKKTKNLRKLIVIPTGGGKTWVGLQIIDTLIKQGAISKRHKVLWAVHTKYLKTQTQNCINGGKHEKLRRKLHFELNLQDYVTVGTIKEISKIFESTERANYGMLIIDEAHHSAARSYNIFFNYHLPIIGLTATPTRLDNKDLPYSDIAYSIKFSDLEKAGVIKMPVMENIPTDFEILANDISNVPNNKSLNLFDTPERNKYIAEWIYENKYIYKFKKIVVFTGSKSHALNLFSEIEKLNAFYAKPFEHVGYIFGEGNVTKGEKNNDDYLEWQKDLTSSVVVNCSVLTEGYDDPSLDAVIMATPSNSTVYYMQCMGRVVRVAEGDEHKKIYLFEFVDRLPNIKYRVDNRWLYNELNQKLQPKVFDIEEFNSIEKLNERVNQILLENNVKEGIGFTKKYGEFGLLLFNDSEPESGLRWHALPLEFGEHGNKYLEAFNSLSESIEKYVRYEDFESALNTDYILEDILGIRKDDSYMSKPRVRETFVYSIARSRMLLDKRMDNDCLKYYKFIVNEEKMSWLEKLWIAIINLIKR